MADDVVQQFSRQSADPMVFVPEQCSDIGCITQVITVITLHVYRPPTQIALCDQSPQTSRSMGELEVMSRGQLKPLFLSQVNKLLGPVRVDCERLLDIHMTAMIEAETGNIEVALRWRSNVYNVRPSFGHKVSHIAEIRLHREPFEKLPRHEGLTV